jgi:hypothetical protein
MSDVAGMGYEDQKCFLRQLIMRSKARIGFSTVGPSFTTRGLAKF